MVSRVGSWKDSTLQMKCAREAVKLIKEYIRLYLFFRREVRLCFVKSSYLVDIFLG